MLELYFLNFKFRRLSWPVRSALAKKQRKLKRPKNPRNPKKDSSG